MARKVTCIAMQPSPYVNFPFRILWQGRIVAGVSRFSGNGSMVTLERGLTHDRAFDEWCSHADARRDISIQLFGDGGQLTTTFHFSRCLPQRYEPMRDVGGDEGVAFATLTLDVQLLNFSS
jgi:hypothetical protein